MHSLLRISTQYFRSSRSSLPAPDPQSRSCRTSSNSSRSRWALPGLNRELQNTVGTAGPQPRVPEPSGHFENCHGPLQRHLSTTVPPSTDEKTMLSVGESVERGLSTTVEDRSAGILNPANLRRIVTNVTNALAHG
eukprot:s895_g21.t1